MTAASANSLLPRPVMRKPMIDTLIEAKKLEAAGFAPE